MKYDYFYISLHIIAMAPLYINTVEHTMYNTHLFIYSVHSFWFRFAIYKNTVLFSYCTALSVVATVANIKIRYNAKPPQFAIFGTRYMSVLQYIY